METTPTEPTIESLTRRVAELETRDAERELELARFKTQAEQADMLKEKLDVRDEAHADVIEQLRGAYYDELTGLKRREFFIEEMRQYFQIETSPDGIEKRANSEKAHVCLALLDIDNFKSVNDTYGHDVGDIVLKAVAKVIQKNIRAYDLEARWGGEEIAVALVDTSLDDAVSVLERIRQDVAGLSFEEYPKLKVTISSGIAPIESCNDLESAMKAVDTALYASKHAGRNRVTVYEN